jgi:glutamate dehydrogenase
MPEAPDVSGLLDEAAKLAAAQTADQSGGGVGDLRHFLGAYYRQMPAEELIAAGPARLAGVATEHARLAASRPQGRALVQVSPGGMCSALEEQRGAVDIVTDDMPFLVDSITMELTRHGLDSFHIIHPQLLVRRDIAGTLWEVVGSLRDARHAHDEIPESWTHIEIDTSSGVSLAELEKDLQRVLLDVRVSVEDYPKMTEAALRLTDKLETEGPRAPAETQALLRWLADNHFTFLGYREYDLVEGEQGMALVPVPGTGLGILRHDKKGSASFAALPPEVRARAKDPQRLILTKANSRSTVHRPSYLDYIAIKRVDETGEPVGEYRFLGLYTHEAYHESIARIPVLRRKLAEVLERSGAAPDSHDAKDLTEILEAYPREELFQISADELTPIALGVLHLRSHPRTRLFLRKDVYGRFMSCVVYLPRDRYTTRVRLRTQEILREALHGETVEYGATVGESPLARLLVVVRAKPGTALAEVDPADLEAKIVAAARSWDEDLAAEAVRELGEIRARALLNKFTDAIPETYKTDVPASYAVSDLVRVQNLLQAGENTAFELWEAEGYVGGQPM